MKITLREASKRYGVKYGTIAQACHSGRLRYTMERVTNAQGVERMMRVVRSADVEALWGVGEESDALTIREVHERTGIGLTVLHPAANRGFLKTTKERRKIYRADGSFKVQDVRVVTEESLAEYMAYRAAKEAESEAKRRPKQQPRMTISEAAKRCGKSTTTLREACHRGDLEYEIERREFAIFDGSKVATRDVVVVTVEALDSFLAGEPQRRRRAVRARRNKARVNNPYREYYLQGKIPEHLRGMVLAFWKSAEAEVDRRRRERRKQEVAL